MLKLDSDQRITAEQAMDHPYLEIYADHDDEVSVDCKTGGGGRVCSRDVIA